MPPSARSNAPTCGRSAPVNAPRSCPNSSLSTSVGGSAPQSTVTNGPRARGPSSCDRSRDELLAGARLAARAAPTRRDARAPGGPVPSACASPRVRPRSPASSSSAGTSSVASFPSLTRREVLPIRRTVPGATTACCDPHVADPGAVRRSAIDHAHALGSAHELEVVAGHRGVANDEAVAVGAADRELIRIAGVNVGGAFRAVDDRHTQRADRQPQIGERYGSFPRHSAQSISAPKLQGAPHASHSPSSVRSSGLGPPAGGILSCSSAASM